MATKQKDPNEKAIILRVNSDIKTKSAIEAKKDNRSLNGHIVNLMQEDLKQRGVL